MRSPLHCIVPLLLATAVLGLAAVPSVATAQPLPAAQPRGADSKSAGGAAGDAAGDQAESAADAAVAAKKRKAADALAFADGCCPGAIEHLEEVLASLNKTLAELKEPVDPRREYGVVDSFNYYLSRIDSAVDTLLYAKELHDRRRMRNVVVVAVVLVVGAAAALLWRRRRRARQPVAPRPSGL